MSQKTKKIILQYKSRREMTLAIGRMRQSTRDFFADIQASEDVMANEKTCRKCRAIKPLSDFYASNTAKDGRINTCTTCHKLERDSMWAAKRLPSGFDNALCQQFLGVKSSSLCHARSKYDVGK